MTQSFDLTDCWYRGVCPVEESEGCKVTCPKFLEMSYLMEHSNLPRAKQRPIPLTASSVDLGAFERLTYIKSHILSFVNHGENLYIMGNTTGNGKTSWAIKLMLKYFDEVWAGNGFRVRALFIHVPTFLLKSKDFNNIDAEFLKIKRMLTDVDLVVWDDIASTDISSYDYSQLLMHIDNRCLEQKANIFTGNLTDRDMMTRYLGAKLTSRIWSDNSEIIEIKGKDRR